MNKRDALWIEMRAAEIAARMITGWRTATPTGIAWDSHELAGWMRAGDKRERQLPRTRSQQLRWHAGWLAAQIWYETLFGDHE
jgi:hypothetical protein